MFSEIPTMFLTDAHLPAIWDCPDLFPTVAQFPEPVVSCPDSNEVGINYAQLSTGSDKPENNIFSFEQNPGSYEPNPSENSIHQLPGSRKQTQFSARLETDERKLRKMLSNRNSAKRCRMRKQKHLENLRNQLNRLRMENRILSIRLKLVLFHFHQVETDNEQLRLEHMVLSQRLEDIRQVLTIRRMQEQFSTSAWPCNNNNAYVASEQLPSLIMY